MRDNTYCMLRILYSGRTIAEIIKIERKIFIVPGLRTKKKLMKVCEIKRIVGDLNV